MFFVNTKRFKIIMQESFLELVQVATRCNETNFSSQKFSVDASVWHLSKSPKHSNLISKKRESFK